MFGRVIGFFILFITLYTLSVFIVPEKIDRYGNTELNTWIRSIKNSADSISAENPKTLAETLKNSIVTLSSTASGIIASGASLVDESKKTYDITKEVVDTKIEQINSTTESVKKAYEAFDEAKKNIERLTTFSGMTSSWNR